MHLARRPSRVAWVAFVAFALTVAMMATNGIAQASHGPAHPPVDVVFLVDESVSMGPEIAAVKSNINYIATQLGTQLDPQFALLGFADGSIGQHGSSPRSTPVVVRTDFTDAPGLATATLDLKPDWGPREAGAYATEYAMNNLTGWRDGAGVCVVLVTDEDNDGVNPANPGNAGDMNNTAYQIANRDAAITAMNARGAVFFGIVPNGGNVARDYGMNPGSMAAATGGSVFNVASFVSNPTPVLDALLNACRIAVTQGIILDPPSAINPAGTDHTVTATVTNSLGDPVEGTTVNFAVISGPNAGATGSDDTDVSGMASFTYTSNGVLGTDEIQATFFDDEAGVLRTSRVVTKTWVDATPPEAACVETVNPSGNNVPKSGPNAGKSGQNPDGFYLISAGDSESGLASVVLNDTDSDASFVLSDGDIIKLTQAPGVEPNIKPGAGDVDWKVQIKGDAEIVATDNAGNTTTVICLVPKPAK